MRRSRATKPPAREPGDRVDAEVERIAAMSVGDLRSRWREVFGSGPPSAFSKDLLARAIAYRLQEQAYGGLSAATARLLRSLAKPGAEPPRRVKVGSVIVREHKGVLHEVMVTPHGFCWRGETYDSLSTIARKITGVNWNGPRFFGLRPRKDGFADEPDSECCADAASLSDEARRSSRATAKDSWRKEEPARRAGRRSSVRTGARP